MRNGKIDPFVLWTTIVVGVLAAFFMVASPNAAPTNLGTIGYGLASGRSVPGTTATLVKTDCNTIVDFTSNLPVAVSVPSALPFNCVVAMRQLGTGIVTPSPVKSVSGATKSAGQFAFFGITVYATGGQALLFGQVQ
jgi:hypothetical protein